MQELAAAPAVDSAAQVEAAWAAREVDLAARVDLAAVDLAVAVVEVDRERVVAGKVGLVPAAAEEEADVVVTEAQGEVVTEVQVTEVQADVVVTEVVAVEVLVREVVVEVLAAAEDVKNDEAKSVHPDGIDVGVVAGRGGDCASR